MKVSQKCVELLLLTSMYFTGATSSSLHLFERQSTCGSDSLTQCGQSGLPSNFCCGSDMSCAALAGNTTVLCCPNGTDCQTIEPIPCDISLQNATLFPANSVHTIALTGEMAACGSACCPFGYTCNGDGNCAKSANQAALPSTSAASSSAPRTSATSSTYSPSAVRSSSPFSSATDTISTPAAQTSKPGSNNSTLPLAESCNKFPVEAILVGFFPGLVAGVLLTVACICLLGARQRSKSKASCRQSSSSFGNISEPQPSVFNTDLRTDFLRKPPVTPVSRTTASPGSNNTVKRVTSLFRRGSGSTMGSPKSLPVPVMVQNRAGPGQVPRTPPMQREPSYENINIFADGQTASALREQERRDRSGLEPPAALRVGRASHQTTFTDMMEQSGLAGLQKGQPYIYRGGETPASMGRRQNPP
ncbi:hypothetical protein BJ878DRAFT_480033 [Calycina marina]|uniref:Uncharacterized protein n=1 Tax=Calycina marina TaxID=1763456 RepID=A0A9P7Z3F4_9HELO|nr:hypothetical protein BJ878DRAFT_480033 [Calycina marina]